MRSGVAAGLLAGLLAAAGCGGDAGGPTAVTGTVRVNNDPAAGASVSFIPDGDNKGHRGTGVTDADGRYEIMGPQGQRGLLPGPYKVVISRPLRKDGSPLPPGTPPIEADARESLPEAFSSPEKTTLRFTVEPGKPADFDLKAPRK